MNLYDDARIIALSVLTQKWNATVAHDELRDSRTKIHTIVMGNSDTFSFDITLPSGRVHKFSITNSEITHKIVD